MITTDDAQPESPIHPLDGVEHRLLQQIKDDPTILGLGDLEFKRALPSCRAGQISILLEDPAELSFYVVELQLGPTDDRHVIRVVDRWAAESKRRSRRRCFAVLVAQQIAPRYLRFLRLIGRNVPLLVLELQLSEGGRRLVGGTRFTAVKLG